MTQAIELTLPPNELCLIIIPSSLAETNVFRLSAFSGGYRSGLNITCECGRKFIQDDLGNTSCPKCVTHAMRRNYKVPCCNCDAKPTVGDSELCGPCCFGEAETIGGNW